ncbi:cupin domain-containing protein [Actinomycetospora flava]|uniref:Cupin domain-containing protein n=1 Tax=Actinomycetospora flava TaxID=3129232 RepID=A0ABU8M5F1_9PSEU
MTRASTFYATDARDPDDHWFTGALATIRAAGKGTGGAMSIVEFLHPADYATPPHVHHSADEAFYVLQGALTGFCGDSAYRAGVGDFVWLPRGVPHGYRADGTELLRTLAITLPSGFDEFVTALSEPAREHALPAAAFLPDPDDFLAIATAHDMTILGPPGAGQDGR